MIGNFLIEKKQNSKDIRLNEKIYNRNIFTDYEYSRICFLSEILNIENPNISKIKVVTTNENFLKYTIFEKFNKLEQIINSNRNINDDILIDKFRNNYLEIKFMNYFENIDKLYHKFNFLYYRNHQKFITDYTYIYFPMAEFLYEKHLNKVSINSNTPIIMGIQGHQGCGKTTLTSIISYMLVNFYNVNCVNLSIDDFYKTFDELKAFKIKNPKFKYRGPPGTHDLNLANEILHKVKNNNFNYYLPRYNKLLNKGLGDRNNNGLFINFPVEILLFEGWFLGALPIENLNGSIIYNNSSRNHKKDDYQYYESFSQKLVYKSNENLKNYIPLWQQCDFFLSIRPFNFKLSKYWRIQTEMNSKGGMDKITTLKFVNYFWRALPPEVYLDKLDELKKPHIKLVIDENRDFYI